MRTLPLKRAASLLYRCCCLFICAASLLGATAAQANPKKSTIKSQTLTNGLEVIVKENPGSPVAYCSLWIRVGSSYEHSGITGISHVLEHVLASPVTERASLVGVNENASTGKDYTNYYLIVEKGELSSILKHQASYLKPSTYLNEANYEEAISSAIDNKYFSVINQPAGILSERLNATALVNSPNANPVPGWITDLKSMNLNRVKNWHKTWYHPNNAILVVVGGVPTQEVFALANHYFGDIKSQKVPKLPARTEIPALGAKSVSVTLPQGPPKMLLYAFQVPTIGNAKKTWEPYALSMLARLVSERVFYASYMSTMKNEGLFTFNAYSQKNVPKLWAAIKKLQTTKVSAKKLQAILAMGKKFQVFFPQGSLQSDGRYLGVSAILGLPLSLTYIDRQLAAVTPSQIQAVAKKYLIKRRLTIGQLNVDKKIKVNIDQGLEAKQWRDTL